MIEKDFVTEGLKRTRIDEYLENELERAGYGGMEIQLTPLGTMIVVYAERPGMVIGRGGKTVRNITQTLKTDHGLENPQVEVKEVDVPELNPKIMAHKIAAMLQRGMHFRRVAYTALRRIMGAGAQGVEVTIAGKIRGSRSATAKFNDGYIKKCGEPALRFVREGFATVQLKPGVLGINVRIMPPGMVLPDKVEILKAAEEEPAVDTIMDTLETEEAEETQSEEIEVEEEPLEDSITEDEEEIEEPVEKTEEKAEEEPEESKEETPEEPEEAENTEDEIEEEESEEPEETEAEEEASEEPVKGTEEESPEESENTEDEAEKQEEEAEEASEEPEKQE
jgi:small subunit ribosomal protein S3